MASSATTPDPDRLSLTTAASRDIFFDVEGYAATKLLSAGAGSKHFQSDKFSVGGYEWAVRYYPNIGVGGSYVAVTLVLLSKLKDDDGEQQDIGVRFACTLQDWEGKLSLDRWRSASYVFSDFGEEKGFWRYTTHDVLEDPEFVVGDCFTLLCTISVLRIPLCTAESRDIY